jgi:hypothetical protein
VAPFIVASFGLLVMDLFQGLCTAPSWQTFLLLTCGWALTTECHPSTTSLWLTGATSVKHCARFAVFLGGALSTARGQLWARILRVAAQRVPTGESIVSAVDDSSKKKAGPSSEGVAPYRHGAGAARQEYRPLRGLNLVWGIRRVPLSWWPGPQVRVPSGWSLYLQEEPAQPLTGPSHSRRALARELVDLVAAPLPARQVRGLGAGGSAPKADLHP